MRSGMSFTSMIVVVALLFVGMAAVAAIVNDETAGAHAQGNPLSAIIVIQPMSQLAVACTDGMILQTLDGPEAMVVRCVRPTPTPTATPTATPQRGNG